MGGLVDLFLVIQGLLFYFRVQKFLNYKMFVICFVIIILYFVGDISLRSENIFVGDSFGNFEFNLGVFD